MYDHCTFERNYPMIKYIIKDLGMFGDMYKLRFSGTSFFFLLFFLVFSGFGLKRYLYISSSAWVVLSVIMHESGPGVLQTSEHGLV